jgi:signal transduction histidine kinase
MLLHHALHLCREVYKLLGHSEFQSVVRDIRETNPDIVINTLNGDSNLYFFRQLKEAGITAKKLPVLSASIAEPESRIMGDDSVDHYACWTYFQSILSPIVGNSNTIHEILLNIATNALHAMDEVGNIHFRCRDEKVVRPLTGIRSNIPVGNYSIVEIEDDGCGIPDDILSKMFEPFFSTRLDKNGTGLGLAVVYGAMKEHNGFIQVETRIGEGTLFRLFFPTTEMNAIPSFVTESTKAVSGISILLVDDEPPAARGHREQSQGARPHCYRM